jgi:hypothetical protein
MTIDVNTSRFTNEIIKSRLGGIPIHDKDIDSMYTISISEKNTGTSMMYVTTDRFNVKKGGEPVPAKSIFKADPITGMYIDFLRLRENVVVAGEEIVMTAKSSVGTANECGNYNCVSTCSYSFTHDKEASESAFLGSGKNKADWDLLDGLRYFKKDSFDFVLESVGIHTNKELLLFASIVLREQLSYLASSSYEIEPSVSTMENCYDVKITGSYNHKGKVIEMKGDYSIGKMIEYNLYTKFDTLTYVSFFKKHPHDKFGILRVAFKEGTAKSVVELVKSACDGCVAILQKVKGTIQ